MEQIPSILLLFAPVILLVGLANLADSQTLQNRTPSNWRYPVYASLILLYITLMGLGIWVQFGSLDKLLQIAPGLNQWSTFSSLPSIDVESLPLVGFGLWLPSLAGLLLLTPPLRRLTARFLPLEPHRLVHAVTLSGASLVFANLLITLGVGLRNWTDLAQSNQTELGQIDLLYQVWSQQLAMVLLAVVGVGWISRHPWSHVQHRLGLHRPTLGRLVLGVALGLSAVAGMILLQGVATLVGMGFDPEVARLSEELIAPLFKSIPGVLTVGLAAAIGEETLLRGAIQPRLGLALTALLFALLHSNYGFSLSTVVVFLLGLFLGWVRMRYDTTTSLIVHATYNGFLAFLGYVVFQLGLTTL